MEHRFGNRRVTRASVVLHLHGGLPVRACIRNVSISGMYVQTPPAGFAANSVIDVELALPGAVAPRVYRWQAMVVRRDDDGVGLMFDRLRPPAITRLFARMDAGNTPAALENVVSMRP